MLEQLDQEEVFKAIKAKTMPPFDGFLLVFDPVVTFETLGLKPFDEEVDGLGPAKMAVVRALSGHPDAGAGEGEFLLTLFEYAKGGPYGGLTVECQGKPTLEMLKAFLAGAATCLTEAACLPTTGRPLGLGEVCWVCPFVQPMAPGFDKDDGKRTGEGWPPS